MASPVDVLSWSKQVTRHDPHGLADLENVLLRNRRENLKRLHHGLQRSTQDKVLLTIFGALATGPLWPLVLFGEGRHWRTGTYNQYQAQSAHEISAICFSAGCIVLGILLLRWQRQPLPRRREPLLIVTAVGYVLCALFVLIRAYERSGTLVGPLFGYLIPVWVTLGLSLVAIGCHWRSEPNPVDLRMNVALLSDEDRAWLLEEREAAVRMLDERGLLEESATIDEILARPLGELHLAEGSNRDQQR